MFKYYLFPMVIILMSVLGCLSNTVEWMKLPPNRLMSFTVFPIL